MISLRLHATMQSPLHIGGETRQYTNAARPMLKTAEGYPYIPATSVKGRLRHEVERLLLSQNIGVCHAPSPESMCQPVGEQVFCPVCRLFGSPWLESALYFQDLILVDEDMRLLRTQRTSQRKTARAPQTESRAGIRINRYRRVVQEDFLFSTELFEPGMPWTFGGQVAFTGDTVDLAPVYLAVQAVNMLGGSRSRGLGWCQLSLLPLEEGIPGLEARAELWEQWKARWGYDL